MEQNEPAQAPGASEVCRNALRRLFHPGALMAIAAYLALVAFSWQALRHLVPDSLSLHLLGHSHVVHDIRRKLGERTTEIGFILPAVFLAEYLWTGWRDCSLRALLAERTASIRSDIACYLLLLAPGWTLICGLMTFGLVYLSGEGVRQALIHLNGLPLSLSAAPPPVQVVVLVLVYTLSDYWGHRLDHSRLFWPLHRFHHAAEEFAVVTASRVHPAAFTTPVGVLPVALLGASPWALLDVGIVIAVIRLVIHSRIASDLGWFGRWVVFSPLHHRLHHTLNRMPVNLGLIPLWDRLFGTYRPAWRTAMNIGTPKPYRHGAFVLPDIWRDYCEFGAGAWKAVTGLTKPRAAKSARPRPAAARMSR